MGPNLKQIVGVTAMSLAVIAGSFGCAGPARNGANRPGDTGPGVTGGTAGTHAGLGNTGAPGGLTGVGWDARTLRTDWGQQISDMVAGMSALGPRGVTGAGAAGGPGATGLDNAPGAGMMGRGPVGVSTLLVGNVAFVGIDTATLSGTAGAGGAAGTPGATAAGLGGTAGTTDLTMAGAGTMPSAPGIAATPWATDMTGVTSAGTGGPSGNVLGRGNGGIRAAYDEPPGGPIALFGGAGGAAGAAGTMHSAPGIAATPWASDNVGVDSAGTTGFSGNVFGRGNGGIRAAHDYPPGGPIPMGGAAVNLTVPSVGGTAAAPGLEAAVRDRVRTAFPQVAEVFVTTDPTLVSRIARLTGSMQAGTSISGQLSEVMAIASAMAGGTTGITTTPAGTTGTTGTTGGTR